MYNFQPSAFKKMTVIYVWIYILIYIYVLIYIRSVCLERGFPGVDMNEIHIHMYVHLIINTKLWGGLKLLRMVRITCSCTHGTAHHSDNLNLAWDYRVSRSKWTPARFDQNAVVKNCCLSKLIAIVFFLMYVRSSNLNSLN